MKRGVLWKPFRLWRNEIYDPFRIENEERKVVDFSRCNDHFFTFSFSLIVYCIISGNSARIGEERNGSYFRFVGEEETDHISVLLAKRERIIFPF